MRKEKIRLSFLLIMLLLMTFGQISQVAGQNDAGSGGDAPNDFASALLIKLGQYRGWMGSNDTEDWYKFSAAKGQITNASLFPPNGTNIDLHLYDPYDQLKASSTYASNSSEFVSFVADSPGEWRIPNK